MIDHLPDPPQPGDTIPDFQRKAAAHVLAQRLWTDQANATADQVSDQAAAVAANVLLVDADALAAGGSRNDANNSRVQAALSAGTATTKAGEASDSASLAATKRQEAVDAAGIAVTARNQAVAAAESIAGGPVASVNGKTGTVVLVPADIGALSTQPISLAAGAAVKALTVSGWYRSNAASDKPADADTYGLVEVNAQDGYRHLRYGNPDGRVWEALWNGAAWTPWRVARFAALGAPANNAVLKDGGEYDVTTGGAAFALAVPANAVLYAGWTAVLFNNLNNWAGLLTLNRNSAGQKINGIADSMLVDQNYRRLVVVARTYDGTNWMFSVAP